MQAQTNVPVAEVSYWSILKKQYLSKKKSLKVKNEHLLNYFGRL